MRARHRLVGDLLAALLIEKSQQDTRLHLLELAQRHLRLAKILCRQPAGDKSEDERIKQRRDVEQMIEAGNALQQRNVVERMRHRTLVVHPLRLS